eukprot:Tbor_TRINITY_DN109_c0_g1::TRINITY_DN109_c0_g1_i1::g.11963::m.11963/K03262/EIF5; translation initiation factor 5
MPVINIDRDKADDIHYRYKMPAIETARESGGNGVKTVFLNLIEVSAALSRPAEAVHKHLGNSVGAQATINKKEKKFFVMGEFPKERIQDLIFDFVNKYVLCKHCSNPETKLEVIRNVSSLKCAGCGKLSALPSDRISSIIASAKIETKKAPTDTGAAATARAACIGVGASGVPSDALLTRNVIEELPPLVSANPIEVFSEAFESPNSTKISMRKTLVDIKSTFGVEDKNTPRLIIRGATLKANSTLIASLIRVAPLLMGANDAVKSDAEKQTIFHEIELLYLKNHPDQIFRLPMALKMLFDENVLTEDDIEKWVNGLSTNGFKSKVTMDENVKSQLMKQLQMLVEWLMADRTNNTDGDAVEEKQTTNDEKTAQGSASPLSATDGAANGEPKPSDEVSEEVSGVDGKNKNVTHGAASKKKRIIIDDDDDEVSIKKSKKK